MVIFLAIAPLMHFRPSKRQREQASLRETAALAGLFVEFRDLPLAAERLARLPASERQLLYYGLRLPPSRDEPRRRQAWHRESFGWQSQNGRQEPPAIAAALPPVVPAFGVSENSCGVYWQEQGDEHLVREIAGLLQDWKAQIAAR